MEELAHRLVGNQSATQRTMILHGVLGRKNNWGSIARKLVKDQPNQLVVLPDLRLHGESRDFEPPHTIESAAHDVVQLARSVEGVTRLVGHSLGSKIATVAAHELEGTLKSLWLIDGTPSAEPDGWARSSGARVTETLKSLGQAFDSREAFLKKLEEAGQSKGIASWLAMNLESTAGGGARFTLDLDAIETLLRDYFKVDNWNRLETTHGVERHLVVGAGSDVVPDGDQQRFAEFGEVHTIEGAGHWVHVDAPDALLDLLT